MIKINETDTKSLLSTTELQPISLINKNECCDASAYNYCKLNKNTFIVILFPSAVGKVEETKLILKKYGGIYYEKEVYLKAEGPKNLIVELYKGEIWLGSYEDNFKGAYGKVIPCFKNSGPIKVFVFETNNFENVLLAKKEIRSLYKIDKNSVHINDTHEETIRLAQILFNENSIHFLNYAKSNTFKRFNKLFSEYKTYILSHNFDVENFCVDSGAILAAYGIREPSDLDFIHHGYEHISFEDIEKMGISSHNGELRYHTRTKEGIIFNPDNHFYHEGFKFASLSVVMNMKEQRGEIKDLKDIRLINEYLKNKDSKIAAFTSKLIYERPKRIVLKVKSKSKGIIRRLIKYFVYN
jgi:hypothetical protein